MSNPHPTPATPFEKFKATYTPLYRVLLVLGGFAILLSLNGLMSLRALFEGIPGDPFFSLSGLINNLIVLPLMIASLILLAHKHPVGIRFRLGGYAAAITAAILGLFSNQETVDRVARQAYEITLQQGSVLSEEMSASITEASFFGAFYISILGSLLFAWLWWKAWKKQVKSDSKKNTAAS